MQMTLSVWKMRTLAAGQEDQNAVPRPCNPKEGKHAPLGIGCAGQGEARVPILPPPWAENTYIPTPGHKQKAERQLLGGQVCKDKGGQATGGGGLL